ncbi:MAG: hypothetical protein KJ070_23425, partial [Verrucomicrobia bacterium]|nr:hypothetical protein [Verrucomicrobiota bacterium]
AEQPPSNGARGIKCIALLSFLSTRSSFPKRSAGGVAGITFMDQRCNLTRRRSELFKLPKPIKSEQRLASVSDEE